MLVLDYVSVLVIYLSRRCFEFGCGLFALVSTMIKDTAMNDSAGYNKIRNVKKSKMKKKKREKVNTNTQNKTRHITFNGYIRTHKAHSYLQAHPFLPPEERGSVPG